MRASVAVLCLAPLLAVPATSDAATSPSVRFGDRPAFMRIVIDMPTGARLSGGEAVEALDARPEDGRSAIGVRAPDFTMHRLTVSHRGTTVRVRRQPGGFVVLLDHLPRTRKFISHTTARSGTRLVIDLWRNTTRRQARILDDGCLRLTAWRGGPSPRARGLELQPLFEHGLVVSLRRRDGQPSTVAQRPVTATPGTFRADFSGYTRPGRWIGTLTIPSTAAGRAMLEAWSASARDGSLECLVQTPVILRPRPT